MMGFAARPGTSRAADVLDQHELSADGLDYLLAGDLVEPGPVRIVGND